MNRQFLESGDLIPLSGNPAGDGEPGAYRPGDPSSQASVSPSTGWWW